MERFYREWTSAEGFIKTDIAVRETDLAILTDKPFEKVWFRQKIIDLRRDIQDYAAKDKRFLSALLPIAVESGAPDIIKQMAGAAKAANVGPMAAVAGAVAQLLAADLLSAGCEQVIIENGGDVFLTKQKKDRLVGIFAGKSKFSGKLRLLVAPDQTPCGICTSSATFGHSLSFGKADSAVIKAKDAALADAVATAACNLVKTSADLEKAVKFARGIPGISGALIILDDKFASGGEIEIKG
ncbi:MAG: UPF0280 family protein [Candidatus Omnitrophota bacterium]